MIKSSSLILAILIVSVLPFRSRANGEIIVILNPSFERTVLTDGNSTGTITDWSRIGPGGILNPTAAQFTGGLASHGENVAFLGASGTILQQALTGNSLEKGSYSFQFDVGNRNDQPFPQLSFHFLVNGTTILPLSSSTAPAVPEGEFRTWTFSYSTNSAIFDSFVGDPIGIRFLYWMQQPVVLLS